MNSEPDMWAERARKIIEANTDNFAELIRLSGLDPRRQLRCANLSGVSFRGCDLRGFDFTGARLHGCDFTDALIEGARFDQAEIDAVKLDPTHRTDLCKAADWDAHRNTWRSPDRTIDDVHLPTGAVFQDAPFAPEMVIVPSGRFMMGSPEDEPGRNEDEGPQHEVTIAQSFAVGRYAVTFEEWDLAQTDPDWRCLAEQEVRNPNDRDWGRGNRPVIDVNWQDARAYVKWLSARTGVAYRLLSEAEWEYCCRAGTTTPFWWGSLIAPSQANYNSNRVYEGGGEIGRYLGRTTSVDAYEPNSFGLYQMHGNVWEWVQDCWYQDYSGAPNDGSVNKRGSVRHRAVRGGSWLSEPQNSRSANRSREEAFNRDHLIGFRVARTLTSLFLRRPPPSN